MADDQKTRTRRTNTKIDIDITNAISGAIKDVGFSNLRFRDIQERGNISSPVINSRYESIEHLIDQYVRRYDYWLNNTVNIDPADIDNPKEYYIEAAERLINSFYNNKEIQRLHIWEMSDDNPTTRRTAGIRESETARLVRFFEERFADTGIDIAAVTAVIVGGIYDIILRKDRSTFCGIDFSKRAGKQRLIVAAHTIISLLYEAREQHGAMMDVARKLLQNGVSVEVISQSTGLSIELIARIESEAGF